MPHATAQRDFEKRPLSDDSYAKSAAASEPISQAATDKSEEIHTAPWRSLFFFTTRSNVPVLVSGIVFSMLAGAVNPAQSYIMGKVFNGFTSYATGKLKVDEFVHHEKQYVFYLLLVSGGAWLTLFLEFATWLAFGELQAKSARDRLFHGLLEKDIAWYDMRKNGIGALLPRLQAQIRELQLASSQPLGALFSLGSAAILSLAQAMWHSWDLTLVTIATVPVIMAGVIWVGKPMTANYERQQQKLTTAQKFSTSAFSSIETVKCFNAQEIEQCKYMESISEAASFYSRVASANATQMALIVLLSVSMFVQGFYYGGVLISKGKKNSGDVITTFISAIGAFQAINAIMQQLLVLEKGGVAGSTLRAIMAQVQRGSNIQQRNGLLKPASCHGDIDIKSVTFAYPSRPHQPALNDVTLYIPGGDITFLIGRSGSGKSTLGQLLMRFYSASHGTISLDGVPLESLDVNWLRTNITLVEQTSMLFNDTVFHNIAFGKKEHGRVSKQEVMEAAEFALLQLMINDMPNGLETLVGYKGGAMSGGQRQRMALARARLRDTPILLLDESTSALDHISRALMMDAVRQWRRGKTTIIITHDISQILPDDYAYILEHGKLVQEGYRKHMEKLKNTPFQNFLPEDQRATISPYDARKGTAFESIRTRGSSLDGDYDSQRISALISDPLEDYLNASENKRASFLPRVFKDGSPLPGMRTGALGTAWMRLAASPPSPPTGSPDETGSHRWSGWWPIREEKRNSRKSQRMSRALEQLVDKTGQVAAESRIHTAVGRRRGKLGALEDGTLGPSSGRSNAASSESTDDETIVVQQSLKQIMKTLWPNLDWNTRFLLIGGFWGATIHAAGAPVFSYVLSKLLKTYATPGADVHKALVYSLIILGVAIVDSIHTYVERFFLEYVSQCWVDNVRAEAIRRILDQSRAFFDKEENSVSRLTGCLDRNAEEMRNIIGRFFSLVWIAILMCAISVIWAMSVQWKMTLIALSAAPYFLGTTKAFATISERWESLSNTAAEDAAAIFTETFTNIKTVRALTLEQHFLDKYVAATNHALKVGFQRSFFAGFFYGLSDSAGNFSIAMVFYVGAMLVKSGTPVQDVVQVLTMLIFTITNIGAILGFIPQIGSSKDSASRLLRLAELPEDSHEHVGDVRINTVGDIVFNDLHFSYPSRPEQTILNHIDMHIMPGTSTAIVGGSGSGKSTIANLLLNLYSTSTTLGNGFRRAGDLSLSGRDIKHVYTPSLRSVITIVSQTPTIFSGTVADNISYGLPRTSPYHTASAISAAATQAGIHDFINSLPHGYSTAIGEGGIGLSGGQAQRIAIARALVRRPAVLILDEATSALDVESANLVRRTIEDLVRDRSRAMTVIIITHSRDMMEIAENIIVLDQGRIVEEGGFEDLLGKNGALANLLSGGEWTGDRNDKKDRPRPRLEVLVKDVDWRKTSRKSRFQ